MACASQRGRGAQLQAQALGQVARAHARRLHALQPVQRALQPRHQLVARLVVVGVDVQHVGQPRGDVVQRVGQVAVVVERFDQHLQRGAVLGASAACRPSARAGGPAARCCRRRARSRRRRPRRWRCCRCLAGRFADAVEVVALGAVFPVVALGGAEVVGLDFGQRWLRRRRRRTRRARAPARRCARRPRHAPTARCRRTRASSSASRKGFCSSICSISCCSSSVDSCSRRIDCCSCGVSARCCDRRTCRDGFIIDTASRLHAEVLAEVHLAHLGVVDDLLRPCPRPAPGRR